MNRVKHVYFSVNGNTGVCNDTEQIPELQRSWLLLFAEYLESQGEDPKQILFHLASGETATVFMTPADGYNWRVSQ